MEGGTIGTLAAVVLMQYPIDVEVFDPAAPSGSARGRHPRNIVNAAAWLLGSEATYTVGATLYIDGGLMLTAAEENAGSSTQHAYKRPGRTS